MSTEIAINRKASHDYFIEERHEAGLVLKGWEVKSLRAGKAQLVDSYVIIKNGEAWLIGGHIIPLPTVSTHIIPDPQRTRKLLLHQHELHRLRGQLEQKGYTLLALSLYWKKGTAKLQIGLAKGKKQYDKRAAAKARDWARQKQRITHKSRRALVF